MSDLISRSDVIQILKECNLDETLFEKDVFDKIRNLPTAYSVDKVVEELEKKSYTTTDTVCGGIFEAIRLSSAIEIVKHGGVSDDVCEWEKSLSGYIGYHAYYSKCCTINSNGLEMQAHIMADLKYCPYCGKKIKIVGD